MIQDDSANQRDDLEFTGRDATGDIENLMNSKSQESSDDQFEQEKIFIEWKNINFYVPAKSKSKFQTSKEESKFRDLEESGKQEVLLKDEDKNHHLVEEYVQVKGRNMKRILKDCTGHACPGEILAIMGPSGSGKTSLLNILSQRQNLSYGSSIDGNLQANKREIEKSDFGKFGAFVQQDDVLLMTFTPFQLLTFAAKMRTNLAIEKQKSRVEDIIKRLRLQSCQNTYVGGILMKGLSGGEKKRTSIGYELITNPNLLILDEPTSGLDSSTALQIIQLLKRETQRGMTVICTIHQPSSAIYNLFNRILALSDGYTVFNGQASEIQQYFQNIGVKFPKFTNPADFLIRLAIDPSLIRKDLSAESLQNQAVNSYSIPDKYQHQTGLNRRFSVIGIDRKITFQQQLSYLLIRQFTYLLRNPRTVYGCLFISIFMIILQSALFHDIGQKQLSLTDYDANYRTLGNWAGFVFFGVSDPFISIGMAQILQIPLLNPVYYREKASGLYSVHAYYLSVFISSITMLLFYPFIVGFGTFYFIKPMNQSADNLFRWILVLLMETLIGSSYGFMMGCIFDSDQTGIIMMMYTVIIYDMGAGVFTNLKNANFVIKFLSYISPFRYANEIQLRRLLDTNPAKDIALEYYTYTYGEGTCYAVLASFIVIFFLVGYAALYYKSRSI
ncbi:abc transporter family protein [Stylonychia lemnae]|uniref:Abc transporter family protein n=1 Tax=Stylonychia lemnae TaxID=5949 RepID=A0A077ZRB4_STYLE|nr:abc transporter family protein [Stylonychia lemnae]|eukprot:CDW71880.1 abc transporter family protein [Stylonychia lemnae]